MKVLILTEGGIKVGLGHSTRCLALAQQINKSVKRSDIIFVVNGDKYINAFLKRQGMKSIGFDWIKAKTKTLSLVRKSDLIIIDSYMAPKALYDEIFDAVLHKRPVLAMIDDYNRIDYPPGIIINPSIYGDKMPYKKAFLMDRRYTYLIGKKYVLLRKDFWDVKRKVVRKEMKDILITFGGMDCSDLIKKLVRFLLMRFPYFNYHVISSNSHNRRNANYRTYSNLSGKEMKSLFLKCDAAISASGQTLNEIARIGTPSIIVMLAKNQIYNVKASSGAGFVKYAGRYNAKSLLENIEMGLKCLSGRKTRKTMSAIGRKYVDGRGAQRIVDVFLDKLAPLK